MGICILAGPVPSKSETTFNLLKYLFFHSNKVIGLAGVFKVSLKFEFLVINFDKSHLGLSNCHEIKTNICEEISERINRKFEQ